MLHGVYHLPGPGTELISLVLAGRVFTTGASPIAQLVESACSAGDPSPITGSGRSPAEGISCPLQCSWASLVVQMLRESTCSVRDLGSIPGLRRSPGEGNGYPLQYSGLENPMDRGAWQATVHGVTKIRTHLSDLHFHFHR